MWDQIKQDAADAAWAVSLPFQAIDYGARTLARPAVDALESSLATIPVALRHLEDAAGGAAFRQIDAQALAAYQSQVDLARELGVTAASLKAVGTAAAELGVSQGQATSIARHLIEVLDDQSGKSDLARATLKAYGVEIDGLTGKDWASVLDAWAAALQGVADSAAKTRANVVVLGSDGTAALKGLETAGNITSAAGERVATLTTELERRISASLQRQRDMADQVKQASAEEKAALGEYDLKKSLALEPVVSTWHEYWDKNNKDMVQSGQLWDALKQSAIDYFAVITGQDWQPAIATDTRKAAISPDDIANLKGLKEQYGLVNSELVAYRSNIDLVNTHLANSGTKDETDALQVLKEKIEAAHFATTDDGKSMDWIQTLVDKTKPARTETDLLDGDLIDVQKYQEWGDALRGALDKAAHGADDAGIVRLKEQYGLVNKELKAYQENIDLVDNALSRSKTQDETHALEDLKKKIEEAHFATTDDGKTMDWIQTLVDKTKPAKTETDLLTEALDKLDSLFQSGLMDPGKYQQWGDALRGALDKAKQGAKDATSEFERMKTSLDEQLYAIGKTQTELLRYRLENARNDDGQAKYTPDQVNTLVGIQSGIDARRTADSAAQQLSRDTSSYDRIITDLKASVTKLMDERQAFIASAVSRLPDSMKDDAAKVATVKQLAAATWDEMQAIKDRTAAEEEAAAAREKEEQAVQAQAERKQGISDEIQHEIADNQSLMDALGKGSNAYDEQATYLNLLNQYRQAGIDLSAAEQDALRGVAAQITANTARMAEMKTAQNDLKSAGQEMGSALSDALKGVVMDGASVTSSLSSLASSLESIAWKMLVTKPLENAFSSALSSSGGFNLSSLFGFADGGIMTADGPLPLKRYAGGGIADSPQLTLFGEGRTPEAYVPLPDGRSIPVTVAGGRSGKSQRPMVINNYISTAGSFRRSEAQIGADLAARLRHSARRNG